MFYFINIIIALYGLLLYAVFRGGVYDYLRVRKMSKTYIRKSMKGFKNYWFYRLIHRENPMGLLYYLNILFFGAILLFVTVALLLGYVKSMRLVIFALSIVVCVIEIPAVWFSSAANYQAEFGKPFVLWVREKKTGKCRSSLVDAFSWLVSVFLIYLSYIYLKSV